MKRLLCSFALIFAFFSTLFAQPEPCGPNPSMTPFCADACIICDINGFTGVNDEGVTGQAPPGFCTNTVHHMQWIGFIAGSTNLTLSVTVFDCQNNGGLEVGIYKSLDCQTFQAVSNCDGDIPPNTTQNFTNTVPLTVGQYYFFVMDGNQNDVCHYTIKVVNGSTQVMPLANSGNIIGPETVCANSPENYTVSLPPGAAHFYWTLNGLPYASETDTTVSLNFLTAGLNQLCVTASNTCDTAFPACRNIYVKSIPATTIETIICANECYDYNDTTLCNTGIYEFHFPGSEGCDSLVRLELTVLQPVVTNLNLILCDGDSIWVGNQPFFQSGQFQQLLTTTIGCDSLVNLNLQVIQCEIQGQVQSNPVVCQGESSGSLQFSVSNGTPPLTYFWEQIGGAGPSGTGSVVTLNALQTIPNLPAGNYSVFVKDNFGNDVVFFQDIIDPPALVAQINTVDYNGYQISCAGKLNGTASIIVSGGAPQYSYTWSNAATTPNLENLGAGMYTCTVTDAHGCTAISNIDMREPLLLTLEGVFQNPGCDGPSTGEISVQSALGGVLPYSFALSGIDFGSQTAFTQLSGGNYVLKVKDANGCEASVSATLVTPIIPDIELGQNLSVNLAESTQLVLVQNTPLDSFVWSLKPGLSCYDCPEPVATPYETTTYTLTAVASGGCTDTDSITVFVQKVRDVYIPNVFSPNDDGDNDYFTVFGGPEVQEVRLEIYSRWGELVYRHVGAANDESTGWNGVFRGDRVLPGVFVWRADILFVDGVTMGYEGNVTVLR